VKKSELMRIICCAFAVIYTALYAVSGDSDFFIALNIFVVASFIIGALEK
jgi:hypothetical protein